MLKKIGLGTSALVLSLGLAACSDNGTSEHKETDVAENAYKEELISQNTAKFNVENVDEVIVEYAEVIYESYQLANEMFILGIKNDMLFDSVIHETIENAHEISLGTKEIVQDSLESEAFNEDEEYIFNELLNIASFHVEKFEYYLSLEDEDDIEFLKMLKRDQQELKYFKENVIDFLWAIAL